MKKGVVLFALIIASSMLTICNAEDKLPSLCDEWNVLDFYYNGHFRYFTSEYKLKNDTIIGAYTYKQLRKDGGDGKVTNEYVGALREDNNARVYYIPADSEHEFLLYAFNAQVGDTLTNLWVGGYYQWYPNGHKAVVKEIIEDAPKTFVIEAYRNGDVNGDLYTPDPHNIMSYSRKKCRDLFTTDQYERIRDAAFLPNRQSLCNHRTVLENGSIMCDTTIVNDYIVVKDYYMNADSIRINACQKIILDKSVTLQKGVVLQTKN